MKKVNKIVKNFSALLLNLLLFTQIAFANNTELNKAFGEFRLEIKYVFSGISGIALLSSIVIFIIHFIKLALNSQNPHLRSECLKNILVSGICTALLGAVNVIVFIVFTTVH